MNEIPVPLVTLEWILILPLSAVFWFAVFKWWRWLDGREFLTATLPTSDDVADVLTEIGDDMLIAQAERGHR